MFGIKCFLKKIINMMQISGSTFFYVRIFLMYAFFLYAFFNVRIFSKRTHLWLNVKQYLKYILVSGNIETYSTKKSLNRLWTTYLSLEIDFN